MKNVRYESLDELPPIGSMWVANAGINFEGVVMDRANRLHQYDDPEVMFMNGTYCTVLESWHKDRRRNMIVIILPKSLLQFTLEYENSWESHGWERV